jgi:hypothetical protein
MIVREVRILFPFLSDYHLVHERRAGRAKDSRDFWHGSTMALHLTSPEPTLSYDNRERFGRVGIARSGKRCTEAERSERRALKINTVPGETHGMPGKRVSIAQIMMFVALAALNLAIARATPWEVVSFPTIWVIMGMLDFVIVWKLILRRRFRAFHYTFLIVLFVTYVVLANLVATERLHPLGLMVRWYQQLSDSKANGHSLTGFLHIGEIWVVALLSSALAYAIGSVAAWLERRLGWDIAALWRGALIGVLIACLLATIDDKAHGWVVPETYSFRWIGRMLLLAVCLVLGGLMGLSKLKSSRLVPEDRVGS